MEVAEKVYARVEILTPEEVQAAAQRDTATQARLQLLQLMLQWGLAGR